MWGSLISLTLDPLIVRTRTNNIAIVSLDGDGGLGDIVLKLSTIHYPLFTEFVS
jgi:hypothetical protein